MRWLAAVLLVATQAAWAQGFTLTSTGLTPNRPIPEQYVFKGFGCMGDNVSPELQWRGAPAGTRSFAVTVYDPDAPTRGGWWHWVVYNLPVGVHALARGASAGGLPAGAVQGLNDFGAHAYGGPCPPAGEPPHHYEFTVYALDVPELRLEPSASPDAVGFAMHSHVLAKARLIATYGR